MSRIIENVRSSRTYNPKTFLAYYVTVLGIVFVGATTLSGMLAISGSTTWLIPWILGFVGLLVVFLVIGIFIVMLVDPSKVMLTQVSGTEYVEIQRATLGDSATGKRASIEITEQVAVVLETQSITFESGNVDTEPVGEGGHV